MLSPLEMKIANEVIWERFGIELTRSEKASLSHYISCFGIKRMNEIEHNGNSDIRHFDYGLYYFMRDYFDLDTYELAGQYGLNIKYGETQWARYGIGVLRTDEFKEFCRRRVNLWREERTFP